MSQKALSRRYYHGLAKNMCIYLLANIACSLRLFAINGNFSFRTLATRLLDYSEPGYAWYLEMYFGLYLLSPFLNLAYRGLTSKKQKQLLLATMIFSTAMPSIINIRVQLIPDWWIRFYPVTYYFLGCYLREYPLKGKKWHFVLGYTALVLLTGVIDYFRCYGSPYTSAPWLSWQALPTMLLGLCVFAYFHQLSTERFPEWSKRLLAKLSDLCLGAYLTSWIFDSIMYPRLNAAVGSMPLRLNYFLLIVPIDIVLSFMMSYVLHLLYQALLYGVKMLRLPRYGKR